MHRHGNYKRYKKPKERRSFRCSATYVGLVVIRFRLAWLSTVVSAPGGGEAARGFDAQAGFGTGLDPRLRRSRRLLAASLEPLSDQSHHSQRRLWADATVRASHCPATVERVAARRWFGGGHVAVSGPALQALALGDYACLRPARSGLLERFASGGADSAAEDDPTKGCLLRNDSAR